MGNGVEFRISSLGQRVESTRASLPFATAEAGDVVVRCPAGQDADINQMLVRISGLLKGEHRRLRKLKADGARLECICTVTGGQLVLEPIALEFLHLVGVALVVRRVGA